MFFEVCLISLGLFTGSELYKKVTSSSGEKAHSCGMRRRNEQAASSAEIQKNTTEENELTRECVELRVALSSLT